MFRTCKIKNAKRAKSNRISEKSFSECSVLRPDERRMPYFEVVSEQVLSDPRYLAMSELQQGCFWRFIIHVLAPDSGITVNHAGAIARKMGMEIAEWEHMLKAFVEIGVLKCTSDSCYLVQHEFREQYLQTLEANNAKRRS